MRLKYFEVCSAFVKKKKKFVKKIVILDRGTLPLVQISKLGNSSSLQICYFRIKTTHM